jgi:hypothetical protein
MGFLVLRILESETSITRSDGSFAEGAIKSLYVARDTGTDSSGGLE